MNWQEKWAVLKLDGYRLYQSSGWKKGKEEYFRYVCEENAWEGIYGAGDTKAQAVNRTWIEYIREKNRELAGQTGDT